MGVEAAGLVGCHPLFYIDIFVILKQTVQILEIRFWTKGVILNWQ